MSTTPPPPPPPPPGDDDPASQSGQAPGPVSDQPAAGQAPPGQGPGLQPSGLGGEPTGAQRNSMAVTALVLGLVAFPGVFLIVLIPFVNLLTVLTPLAAIAAVIFGIVGIRRAKRPTVRGGVGMSVTGMILGLINLLGTIALIVGVVQFLSACPGLTDARSAEGFMDAMLNCAEEREWMTPQQIEQFREQMEQMEQQGQLELQP